MINMILYSEVMQMPLGSCPRKLALLQMAAQSNQKGRCCCSYEKLATLCCISKRTAQRVVKDLLTAKFISVSSPDTYQLTLEKGDLSLLVKTPGRISHV